MTSRKKIKILIGGTLASTDMCQVEVFAISDCLVGRISIAFVEAFVQDGLNY